MIELATCYIGVPCNESTSTVRTISEGGGTNLWPLVLIALILAVAVVATAWILRRPAPTPPGE